MIVRTFLKSLSHALRGLSHASLRERNFQIELFAAALVIPALLFLPLELWEVVTVLFLVGWVLVLELINTAIERIVDILMPRVHPNAKLVKDLMAASVLIISFVSVIIAVLILLPAATEFFHAIE